MVQKRGYIRAAALLWGLLLMLTACSGGDTRTEPESIKESAVEQQESATAPAAVEEAQAETERSQEESEAESAADEESSGTEAVEEQEVSLPEEPAPFYGQMISLDEERARELFRWGEENLVPGSGETRVPGTQAQLEQWYSLVSDTAPAVLYVLTLGSESTDITADYRDTVVAALRSVRLGVFADREDMGNTTTAGSYPVLALDENGNTLWRIDFNGHWFTVEVDSVLATFDGTAEREVIFDAIQSLFQ